MAKYMNRNSTTGVVEEVVPITTSSGAGDALKIVQTDAAGRLDASVMPVGIGADTFTANASGALTAGDAVYVTSGGLIARASAASGGNSADGFVLASSSTGTSATIFFEGRNTALTGLTVGSRYYLSDSTPGGITTTPVTGAGKIHQYLGKAITATTLSWEPDDAILLAS